MRHRLTLMAVTRTQDDGGGYARADVVLANVWARITTIGALEANTYSQLQERVTHKAMIRWRDDVAQGQTAVWLPQGTVEADEPDPGDAAPDGTALYIVTAVDADPDGRPGEFMNLICREGGNL